SIKSVLPPIGNSLTESYMKKLLERSGKTQKGSITGIYTVLVDGDDLIVLVNSSNLYMNIALATTITLASGILVGRVLQLRKN
ncbi:hypothetical protein ACT453_23580, partial [Bacillus sp. D-CC]